MLGRFSVSGPRDGAAPIQFSTRKVAALLAYLAMSKDFAASREALAALLWGDCPERQARQSLRQALALLRKDLGPHHYFTADATMVRLDGSKWSIDALEFERLARSSKADDIARATEIFGGDFLDGLNLDEEDFREWLNSQRARLQMAAGHLCETIVKHSELVLDSDRALAAVDQLIRLDPLREDWQRLAIDLYARYRGKHDALARAAGFASLLQRELGVVPEKETRALVERIRNADTVPITVTASSPPTAIPAIAAAPDLDVTDRTAIPLSSPAAAANVRHRASWLRLAILVAFAASALLAAVYLHPMRIIVASSGPSSLSPEPSAPSDPWQSPSSVANSGLPSGIVPIVVLPFAALGGADVQLTVDMLTDDLTNTLSRIPSFRVISQQTARDFRNRAVDIGRLGAEFQVRYVLDGTVRLQDDKLRINIELIDPATRLSVWSGRIERDGADRQGVRDEIVSRLARELQFEVLPIESSRLSENSDAGALAYRGWAALSPINRDGYEKALALFNEALKRDPQNLSAQIGIGAYHARMGAQVFDADANGHRAKAEAILREALVRDPNSSQAHFYLALALNRLPTLPEALEHLRRAITIDPSDASAHAQIGNALIRSGQPREGLDHVHYAMRLSPRDPVMPVWLEFAGNGELELRHYHEAATMFERSISLNAGYPRSWAGLVAAHALAGETEEANRCAERLRAFAPQLSNEALTRRFGRHNGSRLREGLQLAFAVTHER
jgi:DNA-binding SARP family transcriptional activator/TolB-like protein